MLPKELLLVCLCFAVSVLFLESVQTTTVRLTRGHYPWEGYLEVYYNGQWGTVCDDSWTQTNTEVVCRQLGFTRADRWSGSHPKYGLPIWLDDVRCSGSESRLQDCRHNSWGSNNCGNENIQLTCVPTTCQRMVAATGTPCQNGGSCVLEGSHYRCQCPPSVTGALCQQDVDECQTDNGGCSHLCTNYNITGYNCSCPDSELELGPDQHTCYSPQAGITCTSQGLSVSLTKAGLPGVRTEYMRVDGTGQQCIARDTPSFIIFNLPLNDCGTTRRADGDEWVYENHITSVHVTTAGMVSPVRKLNVTVRCRYPQHVHVHGTYHVHSEQLAFQQDTHGQFPIKLDIEQGGHMYHPGGPALVVDPGAPLTIHFSLDNSHQGLEVFAHNCNATPTAHNTASGTHYNIIKNGCILDSTLQDNRTGSEELLTLQAFKFVGTSSLVFLHCDVMVCNASDPTSRCQQGCLQPSTHTRSILDPSAFLEQKHVTIGPLRVQPLNESFEEKEEEGEERNK